MRLLVTTLTATMMIGLVILVTLIVIRFKERQTTWPDAISIPSGVQAVSITSGKGWFGIVTDDQRLLIYAPDGTFQKEIKIEAF